MTEVELVMPYDPSWQSGQTAVFKASRKTERAGLLPQPGRPPRKETVPLMLQSGGADTHHSVGVIFGYNALVVSNDTLAQRQSKGIDLEGVYLVDCSVDDGTRMIWCHPRTVVSSDNRIDASRRILSDRPPPSSTFYVTHPDQPIALGPFFGIGDRSPYGWARTVGVLTSMISFDWIQSPARDAP